MRRHAVDLAKTTNIDAFIQSGHDTYIEILPGLESLRPPALPDGFGLSDDLTLDHLFTCYVGPVFVSKIHGHVVGGNGFLRLNDSILHDPRLSPGYYSGYIDTLLPTVWEYGLFNSGTEVLRHPVPLGIVQEPNMVYGHFLIEMLHRLWILSILGSLRVEFDLALSTHTPAWMNDFCSLFFEENRIVRYDPERESLSAPAFLVPSRMENNYNIHPLMNLMVRDILARVGGVSKPRSGRGLSLFLSRAALASHKGSRLEHTLEIAYELNRLGFQMLIPERLPVVEQLRLYSHADVILGDYGSAIHNSMFAPQGSAVIVINRLNNLQSRLCGLRAQRLCIVKPCGGFRTTFDSETSGYSVPLDDLARAIRYAREPV